MTDNSINRYFKKNKGTLLHILICLNGCKLILFCFELILCHSREAFTDAATRHRPSEAFTDAATHHRAAGPLRCNLKRREGGVKGRRLAPLLPRTSEAAPSRHSPKRKSNLSRCSRPSVPHSQPAESAAVRQHSPDKKHHVLSQTNRRLI